MVARLHLGCGIRRLSGFTHIDSREEVEPDILCDICQLKIPDDSVEVIYASHVLEHLKTPDRALCEWRRVLKPGAWLYLAVPDFGALVECYIERVALDRIHGLLHGRQDYPDNLHWHSWDFERLANLLRECGYYDVQRWDAFDGSFLPENYHDISQGRIWVDGAHQIPISLNVRSKVIGG